MATINLAPGTQYAVAARQRRQRIFVICAGIVVLLAATWIILTYMTSQATAAKETVDGQLRTAELAIAKAADDAKQVVAFTTRLETVNALLDNHIVWNPVFTELERLLPPPTVLTNLTMQADSGRIDVQGTTTDVDALAQLLASLHNSSAHQTLFTSASLVSAERLQAAADPSAPVSYKFTAVFNFNPKAVTPGK